MYTTTTTLCATWLILASTGFTQTVIPSNSTTDLYPVATSPRFLLNGSEIHDLPSIRLAPLGDYARMSHDAFVDVEVDGHLVNINAFNANENVDSDQFSYISCDPSAYADSNIDASDVFRIAVNQPRANIVILYSEVSDHCSVQGLDSLPVINGVLTTTEAMAAAMLADLNLTLSSPGSVTILPDLNAYTNSSNGNGWGGGINGSPTTAVAMIILYSITGVITALFVVIIITGAVRAHRHPERYGPRRAVVGRGRQSRARGVARAMLDTLPIVKFGDRLEPAAPQKPGDIEMNSSRTSHSINDAETPATTDATNAAPNATTDATRDAPADVNAVTAAPANADGTDEAGHLGCSICTEDFNRGEEVRVLPCNHKFHPACVDPWLLNVSGTCPLCRIDLRPQTSDDPNATAGEAQAAEDLAPPLAGDGRNGSVGAAPGEQTHGIRRLTLAQLRVLARTGGSSEDRIAALRRYRQENRATEAAAGTANEGEERRGLARRLRERFHIRTMGAGNAPGS
jgi:hypothetical protein